MSQAKERQNKDPWKLHLDRPVILGSRQIEGLNQEIQLLIDNTEDYIEGDPDRLRMDILTLCRLADIGGQYLKSQNIKSLVIDAKELVTSKQGDHEGDN